MGQIFNHRRPKDLERFVLDRAESKYLIYDGDTAYCTGSCRECIRHTEKLRHNMYLNCDGCRYGFNVKALSKGRGRKKREERGRVMWTVKVGPVTYVQIDDYIIDYTNVVPEVRFIAWEQFKLSREEQRHITKNCWYGKWSDEEWNERKTMFISAPQGSPYTVEPSFTKLIMYDRIEFGTDLEYASLEGIQVTDTITYLSMFLKYPWVEMLQKAGAKRLLQELLEGETSRSINKRAKSLQGLMKCDKKTVRTVIQNNLSIEELEKHALLKKYGVTMEESMGYYGPPWTLISTAKWIEERGLEPRTTWKYLIRNQIRATDYKDYIEDCIKLEKDIHNRKIARPVDFRGEHMRLVQIVKIRQTEEEKRYFIENTRRITEMESPFVAGGLMIVPAGNAEELNKESEELHHCVRTYAHRVSEGNTAILFIRQIQNPGKPYYTLELSPDHRIVQCRGMANCDMTPEVATFVNTWKEETYGRSRG